MKKEAMSIQEEIGEARIIKEQVKGGGGTEEHSSFFDLDLTIALEMSIGRENIINLSPPSSLSSSLFFVFCFRLRFLLPFPT